MKDNVRVVVGHEDADGKSQFREHHVDRVYTMDDRGLPVFGAHMLWGLSQDSEALRGGRTPEPVVEPFFPEVHGMRFLSFTFLPEPDVDNEQGAPSNDTSVSTDTDALPGILDVFEPERPGMHKTDTVDFGFVAEGQIYLESDAGEVLLTAGDFYVQLGANHAWHNRSTEPAVVVGVMIGADRNGGSN